ncbi:hypothetical protein SprV_0501766600 [Sparganum proliferum]
MGVMFKRVIHGYDCVDTDHRIEPERCQVLPFDAIHSPRSHFKLEFSRSAIFSIIKCNLDILIAISAFTRFLTSLKSERLSETRQTVTT